MVEKHFVYSAEMIAPTGLRYAVRYLHTAEELAALQAVGLIPQNACEVVGMQAVADGLVSMLELNMEVMNGKFIQ